MLSKFEALVPCSSSSSSKSNFKARLGQNWYTTCLPRQLTLLSSPLPCQSLCRASTVGSHSPSPTTSASSRSLSFSATAVGTSFSTLKRSEAAALSFSIQDSAITAKSSSYLQSTHLQHLCKQGSLQDARLFFSGMNKDTFSWNLMMSEYARLGCYAEVLYLFDQMQNEGIVPNKFIFATVLSACGAHGHIGPGRQMHARIQISEGGLSDDSVVQTALVNLYGRFGELAIAGCVFESDPSQDVALWNAILTVFAQHGQSNVSWVLYSRMQQLGIFPNKVTFIILLSVCSSEATLKQGKELHSWVINVGLEDNIVVGTALINMYSRCGSMDTTEGIFDGLLHRDLILWNSMISGQALNERPKKGFQLLNQMQQEGVMPNIITLASALDACRSPSALGQGKLLHAYILGIGFGTETIAGAALLNMYGKCGSLDAALQIFHEMADRKDTVLWNTMISIYAKQGIHGKALQLYSQMRERSIVVDKVTIISMLSLLTETHLDDGRQVHIYATHVGLDLDMYVGNVLVTMYGLCGNLPDALVIFNRLSCPDAITYVNMITACTSQAVIAEGNRLHSMLEGTEMERNVVVGNALINMYSKCGSLVDAQRMFQKMPEKNVVTWSTIIAAYAQHGEGQKVFSVYSEMCKRSIIPDNVTRSSLLVACSHAGNIKEALDFFHSTSDEQTAASLDQSNCMIDLLGRLGSLDLADQLARCMPFLPSSLSWSMLVCACHIHADIDRGCFAANYALELDSDDATMYVLLSNIYGAFAMEV
ncbi:hypothetical protein GOP47_0028774 [Adiantum capillus-veneris]|nr:hypothetical protein GOP47_0028774 [Adiantum capillus-veneris]